MLPHVLVPSTLLQVCVRHKYMCVSVIFITASTMCKCTIIQLVQFLQIKYTLFFYATCTIYFDLTFVIVIVPFMRTVQNFIRFDM